MTFAASSHVDASATENAPARHHFFGRWSAVLALCISLTVVLALIPDGVADSVQALVGWLVVGAVAVLAVMVVIKGLERLLDCEAD